MSWGPPVPAFSGDAGIGELVAAMREPAYLKLLGKAIGTGLGAGLLVRRLPPQVALPVALVAGIYLGLEMAAWMEEETVQRRRRELHLVDATAVDITDGERPELAAEGDG